MTDKELVDFWKDLYLQQAQEIAELKLEIDHYAILVKKLEGKQQETPTFSNLDSRITALEFSARNLHVDMKEFTTAVGKRFHEIEERIRYDCGRAT